MEAYPKEVESLVEACKAADLTLECSAPHFG